MAPVTVSRYLYTRLAQLGVGSLHGVPGDFNIFALDELAKAGVRWVGNCNELNAGYAADGYARVKNIGALATTFGVGELSAINAIAGSYAEHVPVVQIVGQPSLKVQKTGRMVHHTLGNSDYRVFADMHSKITAAQAILDNPAAASREIDRVLGQCVKTRRPVYLAIPADVSMTLIDGGDLDKPIETAEPQQLSNVDLFILAEIIRKLHTAQRPVLLVDAGARQHGLLGLVESLMTTLNIPTITTPMGKSCVNESFSNFHGVYDGTNSGLTELVQSADLVLSIGVIRSDLNTAGFMAAIDPTKELALQHDSIVLDSVRYGIPLETVLGRLVKELAGMKLYFKDPPLPLRPRETSLSTNAFPPALQRTFPNSMITHDYLWNRISSWLKPRDIILNSSGTSNMGIVDTKFPPQTHAISQILWSSIGYTLAATQGAALAAEELGGGRRVVLFEGDGAFQMTAQEISTMLRLQLKPIIFVLNNKGYTTERWINGATERYNDVANWDYAGLPHIFSEHKHQLRTYKVETRAEFEALLDDESFGDAPCLQLVEMRMPVEDAPIHLKRLAQEIILGPKLK